MQQLKNQNGLLLQLVTGLQNQINSKNRQNQILFQQYDQLAQDNAALRSQIDALRNKVKEYQLKIKPESNSESSIPSPKDKAQEALKQQIETAEQELKQLRVELDQKGGMIILLESQLAQFQQRPPEPVDNSVTISLQAKIAELQETLTMKQDTINELTEYMNDQANKISELTRESITTINNYELKLEQKDKQIEEIRLAVEQGKQGITEKVGQEGETERPVEQQETSEKVEENPLQAKVAELELLLSMKQQSVSELSEFLQSQSQKLSNLQSQLSQGRIPALEEQIESLKQIISSKEQSISQLSQFLQSLSTKSGESDDKLRTMENKHEDMQESWRKERQQLQKEIAMLKLDIDSRVTDSNGEEKIRSSPMLDEIHVKLSTKEDEVNRLKDIIIERQQALEELQRTNTQLVVRLEKTQATHQNSSKTQTPDEVSVLALRQALAAKQKYIDQFSEYMNEQLAKVNELAAKVEVYEAREAQGKEADAEMKLKLQGKEKDIAQFSEYINQQLKVVAELTAKLRTYEEKQQLHLVKQDSLGAQEREKYEQIIRQLRQCLESKQCQLDQFSEYMNEQLKTVGDLRQQLRQQEEAQERSQKSEIQQRALSSDERDAYESTIRQLKEESDELKGQMSQLSAKIKELEASRERINSEQQSKEKQQTDARGMQQEQDDIIVFSEKIEQLQQILKSKEESLTEMSQFLEEYYVTKAKLEQNISNLQEQNSALKLTVQKLTVQRQGDHLSGQSNATRNTQQLSEKGLEEQLAREIQTIRELKFLIEEKEEQLTQLLNKIDQKDNDYKDLEQIISAKTETIAELSSYMNDQGERLAELEGLVEKFQAEQQQGDKSEYHEEAERKNANDDNLTQLSQKISNLEKVIEEKDATIAGLTELIQQREQTIQQLQQAQTEQQSQGSATVHIDSEKISQLQAQIVNQGETILLLKEQAKALEIRENQLQNELDAIQNQHRNLTEESKELKGENKELRDELAKIKESSEAGSKGQKSRKQSYRMSELFKEQMTTLKQKIVDLEDTIQGKAETIKDLTEFMNEQATKLVELESKDLSRSGETDKANDNSERIQDLQTIIKSKEESIAELTEYLNENYTKITALEQQVREFDEKFKTMASAQHQEPKSDPTITDALKESEALREELEERTSIELSQKALEKREILNQLELAIDQKQLELEFIKDEIVDQNKKLQEIQLKSGRLQQEAKKGHKKQIRPQSSGIVEQGERKSDGKDERNAATQSLERRQNLEQFFLEKEQEINSITQIIGKLQEELKSKNEMIQQLKEALKVERAAGSTKATPVNSTENSKDRKIEQMAKEIAHLQEKHKELMKCLQKQQEHLILQEQYDIIGLEEQMRKESKRCSDNLKQELEELKQSQKNNEKDNVQKNVEKESVRALKESADREQSSYLSQMREENLTTTELLSQLMLYSDEGANMRAIKVLIASLSQKYHRELVEYENQSGQLKETVESLIEVNENLSLEVRNFRESLREKDHLISELNEINQEKEQSYHQRLEEIRQSLTMLGSDVPNFLNRILQSKEDSPQRESLKPSQRQSLTVKEREGSPPKLVFVESDIAKLRDETKELKEQIDRLREQSQLKDRELQQLRELRTNKNKTYQRQLEDLLMDSNVREDPSLQLEELQTEKQRLLQLCAQLQEKLGHSENQRKEQAGTIEVLNEKIKGLEKSVVFLQSAAVEKSDSERNGNGINAKVLADLQENIPSRGKQSEKSGWRQSNGIQQVSMESKMLEKDEIIMELEQTILKIEKGYNGEIMELRRNIAELEAEVISLRRHLYIADPSALDVAELVRETCTQQAKPTQFYKPTYRMRYGNQNNNSFNYSPVQPLQNASFYTQSKRSTYEPYYNSPQMTLGQKMMGRRMRDNLPLNLTINNEFKVHNAPWEQVKMQPL